LRKLALAAGGTAGLTYALVVLGALVRATDSGLSCPDWPTCYGRWILTPEDFRALPATGYTYLQVMLEWGHRLLAAALVGPAILVTAVLAWRARASDPALPRVAAVMLALLLVQGALGGLTVLDRNSPWSVALHLGNALVLLSTILWLAVRAAPLPAGPVPRAVPALAGLAWLVGLAAMTLAAITAKSGASLACASWPSCDGTLLPDLGDPLVRVHLLHRLLAGALGLVLVALAVVAAQAEPGVRRLARAAAVLVLAQIGLGGLVIVLAVPVGTAVLHQAVGVLTLVLVTLLWGRARRAARAAAADPASLSGDADGYALRGA
jgi:cytochrome c oxidase assembly protein subunit 15